MPERPVVRRGRIDTLRRAVAAAGLGLAVCAPVVGQRIPPRILPTPIDFATGEEDNLFSLSRSQDNIHEWETGLAELAAGDVKTAVDRLHRLLQTETGGVVPIAPGRFLGLRLAVVTTLANLTAPAAEAYEALAQRDAGSLGQHPLHELDPDQLELLARRFPAADIGRRARLRLGDLALEAGDGRGAADHFRQALDAAPIGSAAERSVVERLYCAGVLTAPVTARASAAARTLAAAGDDVLTALPATTDPTGYRAVGGGGDGRLPMDPPAGRPEPLPTQVVHAPGFERRESGLFAMFPTGSLDGVYVNTGREVVAFDPLRGGLHWISHSPMGDEGQGANDRDDGEQINNDMVLAAAYDDDVVVAALQVPDKSFNVDFQGSFRVISKIPQRRLFAFSRRTGKLVWSHFDELDGQRTRRFRGHDACGPPVILGDTVYAAMHDRSGAIAFSVAAYDLATGQPKWRRLVCSSQQDVNMFGNARLEFAASPLAIADGVLYGTTNLGVCYAVEVATGRIRWITSYEVVRMPRTMLHGQPDRPVYFANNAPVVADGVVCTTPLDSQFVLGLCAETGQLLWRIAADAVVDGTENHVRWLAGVLDDEFVLAGRGVIAVKARPKGALDQQPSVRQFVRPDSLRARSDPQLSARPAVTADHVWFARSGRITGFDRAGNEVAPQQRIAAPGYQPGNLLFVDGIVVSLRQRGLDVLMDAPALQQQLEARLRASPDEPAAILRLASLRRALLPENPTPDTLAQLMALYRRGIDACLRRGLPRSHPLHLALQRELFEQALDEATRAVRRTDARALDLLVAAREEAPDTRAFVQVQSMVLDLCRASPAQLRVELDRLEQQAAAAIFPVGTGVPVGLYVLWQRALLPDQEPAVAVALWQELLETHGGAALATGTAAETAEAAIARLVERHGPEVYAAIAARADAALARAGDDPQALQDVGTRFPNSRAAGTARLRLLDRPVREGNLALAGAMLAQEQRDGAPPPGIVRRVLVAALARGSMGLASALADRLRQHASEASDWPDDAGATYGEVLDALAPRLRHAATAARVGVPQREVARIPPRSPRDAYSLVPVLPAEGFPPPTDQPLYARHGAELHAIDVHVAAAAKPVLFALPIQFPEHLVLCGTVLVVPDLERVFAVDYRTGATLWELPLAGGRLFDGLGVQAGVLHVAAQSGGMDGGGEFLGIEPLSGAVLFRRTFGSDRPQPVPKPVQGQLLMMEPQGDGGAALHRLDPLSGASTSVVQVDAAVLRDHVRLQPDGLSTRLFPRGLCADAKRVYVPIDSSLSGDAPRLVAIDDQGKVAWQWNGSPGYRLIMAANRGDRVVVAEVSEQRRGRIVLLGASDGGTLREAQLGHDVTILNWERSWLANPAPAVVAISDQPESTSPQRRFVTFAVDDDQSTFEFRLASEDGDVERQPLFGADFVTFGVRPAQRGPVRLYTLLLRDRSGALPGGAKYQRLDLKSSHGVGSVGAYTVVSATEGMLVLGPGPENK